MAENQPAPSKGMSWVGKFGIALLVIAVGVFVGWFVIQQMSKPRHTTQEEARAPLEKVLDSWQKGTSADQFRTDHATIQFSDDKLRKLTLTKYEIASASSDGGVHQFVVKIVLKDAAGKEANVERTYKVGYVTLDNGQVGWMIVAQ